MRDSRFAFFLDLAFPEPSLDLIRENMLGIVAGSQYVADLGKVTYLVPKASVRLSDQIRLVWWRDGVRKARKSCGL